MKKVAIKSKGNGYVAYTKYMADFFRNNKLLQKEVTICYEADDTFALDFCSKYPQINMAQGDKDYNTLFIFGKWETDELMKLMQTHKGRGIEVLIYEG